VKIPFLRFKRKNALGTLFLPDKQRFSSGVHLVMAYSMVDASAPDNPHGNVIPLPGVT
jgi:hypothetical protein